jgi:hypothetical protein
VASVTDSPSVGTRISVMACFLLREGRLPGHRRLKISVQETAADAPLSRGMTNGGG